MPLSPYRSVVRNTFMTPTDVGTSVARMPFDHENLTNRFIEEDENLHIARSYYGRPFQRRFARRHNKLLLDLQERIQARKTLDEVLTTNPLRLPGSRKTAKIANIHFGFDEESYRTLIEAPRIIKADKALPLGQKAEQDACQVIRQKEHNPSQDPRLLSRRCPAPTICTADTPSLADTDITKGVSRLTVNESRHVDRDKPLTRDGPPTQDESPTQDGFPTQDGPRVVQVFGFYDQEISGEADIFRSLYSDTSGIPFAGLPYTGVPSNAYTNTDASIHRPTGLLTVVPSNAYSDADGNLLPTSTPVDAHRSNVYTDDSIFETTVNFGQQNDFDSTEMPIFTETLFDEGSTFAGNQNMLIERPSITSCPTNAFDAGPEFVSIRDPNMQTGGVFSDGFLNAPDFLPNLPSQTFPGGLFDETAQPSIYSPALDIQNPFFHSTNQATDIDDDPFLNLSDEAINAHLYALDQPAQESSFNAHVGGNGPIETGHRFIQPSTPASQARLQNAQWAGNRPARDTIPTTPSSGAYPHLSRPQGSQFRPRLDWRLINYNNWPGHTEDYFFPSFIDSKGAQIWFPKAPGYFKPKFRYHDWSADYYMNVGVRMCEEEWCRASNLATRGTETGHPAFAARPASTLPVNFASRSLRTSSAIQGATASGNPRPAVLEEPTPQTLARANMIIAGRKGMGLPTRNFIAAANAPASRTAAGSRRPTEARKATGTPAPRNKDIRRLRGLKPRDSGTIGEPISIPDWIAKNVKTDQSANSQLTGSLGGSVLPKIHNPAKKSKAPGVHPKLTPLKRREKRPAPSVDPIDEVVGMRSTRRKTRHAPSIDYDDEVEETRSTRRRTGLAMTIESDGDYPIPKRHRKGGKSRAVIRPQDILRAGSEAGSLADAEGDNESLTACDTRRSHRTPDGDSGHAA
ncbi:hypothetical protein MMC17_004996 [Xylographa soralifera]|nr:hypothetical protein [Xylographa soralifera]